MPATPARRPTHLRSASPLLPTTVFPSREPPLQNLKPRPPHPASLFVCALTLFSRVPLFATPWTVARQVPQRIFQARILKWIAMPSSRGPSPSSGRSCVPERLLHWQVGSLPLAPPGKPLGPLYSPTNIARRATLTRVKQVNKQVKKPPALGAFIFQWKGKRNQWATDTQPSICDTYNVGN